ncbi:hypothetical protein EVG20_g4946 [Dentipellis fragilis]|uniref:Uncharacterized protein n=1 Tax=Dentipellis fragilis TaxID=205917 RepID=A0A4Y9YX38_9AGAM|nr:hypothetical protein EVG20_g4946 [Dentipellis fragilis]
MDIWPTDTRPQQSTSQRRKGKSQGKAKETSHYTAFEVGTLTAGTLSADGGRLEWTTIPKSDKGQISLYLDGPIVKAFPVTRSKPLYIPYISVKRRAEQGAHFLRTYHPDVDIPAELIRDVVSSEMQFTESLENFDPGLGVRMAVLYLVDRRRKKFAFLAFPMGESGSELNISEIQFSKDGISRLVPTLPPIQQFETPIRQISTFSYPSSGFETNPVLAVRTFTSIIVFAVRMKSGKSSAQGSKLELVQLSRYESSELGGGEVVDVKLCSSLRQVFSATDQGVVFKGTIGGSVLDRAWSPDELSTHLADGFWRITESAQQHGCFLSSSKVVMELDFRVSDSSMTIERDIEQDQKMEPMTVVFEVSSSKDFITSIEYTKADGLLCITTTSEVLWINPRFPGKPLIACKHNRDFDRTLRTHTLAGQAGSLTLLSSLNNDLLTLYHVNRNADGSPLHLTASPYCLSPFQSEEPHLGLHFLEGSPDPDQRNISLFQMSNRRAIFQRHLTFSPEGQLDEVNSIPATLEWDTTVKEFELKNEELREAIGPLGSRDANDIDLRLAYERLFMNTDPEKSVRPEEVAELFYETLERMPDYLQDPSAVTDQMLTVFDIAFRADEEPQMASRADFLTQSALSSTRGYRALLQDRIPISNLRKQVAWSYDLSPFLARFIPGLSGTPQDVYDHLQKYNLAMDDYRSGPSIRRETESREQLTLDLALSSSVLSPRPFSRLPESRAVDVSTDALETMSRATQALSIGAGDLPPIQFGYLSPVLRNHYNRLAEESPSVADKPIDTPLGVRLLLQEWDIGTDPDTYEFHNPYGSADQDPMPSQPRRHAPTPSSIQPKVDTWSQSQRPPMIASSQVPTIVASTQRTAPVMSQPAFQTIVPVNAFREPVGQSQGAFFEPAAQFSSQEIMPSTQIMAGPYGGRQGFVKKKPQKKRFLEEPLMLVSSRGAWIAVGRLHAESRIVYRGYGSELMEAMSAKREVNDLD